MDKQKSQAFTGDFVVSALILIAVIIIYFSYIKNLPDNSKNNKLGELFDEAKAISLSLMSSGYPSNWDANNVVRIGFIDDGNIINNDKIDEFAIINYNKSKRLLGTLNDYFLYFINGSGNVTSVEGFCGIGNTAVSIGYDIKAAYYYKDPEDNDQYLREFMVTVFKADVYTEDGIPDGVNDLFDLRDKRNDYGIIVLEAPEWNVGQQYNNVKDQFNEWTDNGGLLMISGELASGQKKELAGASFEKDQGLSSPQEPATVVNIDEYLDFEVRDRLEFDQGFTVKNAGQAVNFKDIARFNESDIEFSDILDNKIGIAGWEYGNGNVFFFSDFDATYFQGNFEEQVKSALKKLAGARCLPINITGVKRENLVRLDRLVVYNSDILKMVLYVWQ